MERLHYLWVAVVETLLRLLPFPCETGLVEIGNPGRNAPVLLTGNFRLTVERVKRAVRGRDAYLLVANSRGVNVWCAATGGLLTNHDVVSVLKTSGIAARVDHRRVILPQLAATGIEARVVRDRTGWRVAWGPVAATSIPAFLDAGLRKSRAMRTVRFPWRDRLEMAVAWAFPISLLALVLLPFWSEGVLPVMAFVWVFSGLAFLGFPLYERRLHRGGRKAGFVFFDFGERGALLLLWLLFVLVLAGYAALSGDIPGSLLLGYGLASLVVVLILSIDLMGSTPAYKSGLHEERLLRIRLDAERCKGAGFCEDTCPTEVFAIDHERRLATLPGIDRCVQCGACIVQCPFDALSLEDPEGGRIPPETIRRFKLNLLGSRRVEPAAERTTG